MKLFEKVKDNQFQVAKGSNEPVLQRLMKKIKEKYPLASVRLDGDSSGNIIIDVETGETNFYIYQKPNGKFAVSAVWPGDEKGKNNLDADKMVKAVGSIPGMNEVLPPGGEENDPEDSIRKMKVLLSVAMLLAKKIPEADHKLLDMTENEDGREWWWEENTDRSNYGKALSRLLQFQLNLLSTRRPALAQAWRKSVDDLQIVDLKIFERNYGLKIPENLKNLVSEIMTSSHKGQVTGALKAAVDLSNLLKKDSKKA